MKNHIVFKFLSVALCALTLLTAVGSGIGIGVLTALNLDGQRSASEAREQALRLDLQWAGVSIAEQYGAITFGGVEKVLNIADDYYAVSESWLNKFRTDSFFYELVDDAGNVVKSTYDGTPGLQEFTIPLSNLSYSRLIYGPIAANSMFEAEYALAMNLCGEEQSQLTEEQPEAAVETRPSRSEEIPEDVYTAPEEPDEQTPDDRRDMVSSQEDNTVIQVPEGSAVTIMMTPGSKIVETPEVEEWVSNILWQKLGNDYWINEFVGRYGTHGYYFLRSEPLGAYTFRAYMTQDAWKEDGEWKLLTIAENYQRELLLILGISLLLFAAFAVYLCTAAGRKPGSAEIRPGGLNCLPLDLYFVLDTGGICLLIILLAEFFKNFTHNFELSGIIPMAFCGYGACLLFVGFCFCAAAQFKTPGIYWWHHSVIGWCWSRCWRLAAGMLGLAPDGWKLVRSGGSRMVKTLWTMGTALVIRLLGTAKDVWQYLHKWLQRMAAQIGRSVNRFYSLLPLTWQWMLTGFFLMIVLMAALQARRKLQAVVLGLSICAAVVLYGANAFGTLLEGTRKMRRGDLENKVEDKLLVGAFRDFAGELNGLADVAAVAAQKQLKSERMKTELITNVSHDIKTPLTSIINYVDLLQKPHTEEEGAAYLEVLSRQSQRMKKLIDDLMEMSKASTGNLPVEITRVDAVEAVNQALGEFDDKLHSAQLQVVYRQPEEPVWMYADGRLVWRALSNLLSNAVKYAMGGTRLYVEIGSTDDRVQISVKNISRESLNVDADELLERFVRGDASRNTEGSGLGLNIARSLMELQHGELKLLVDGDLFKATLFFPKA